MKHITCTPLNSTPLSESKTFETAVWNKNELIFGIDEVGRGCLAGPVVTCCVALFPHKTYPLLIDSKILTENKRIEATTWIKNNAWYAFGIESHHAIDKLNIYQATLHAMKRAFYGLYNHPQLPQKPSLTLIDAVPLTLPECEVLSFIKGESRSISIAAASILAKTYRDELMTRLDPLFPGYGFADNKSYGTLFHQQALQKKGPTLLHRKTFLSNIAFLPPEGTQLSLV